jgi:hypothetical protein
MIDKSKRKKKVRKRINMKMRGWIREFFFQNSQIKSKGGIDV